jgi:hypothetical protein
MQNCATEVPTKEFMLECRVQNFKDLTTQDRLKHVNVNDRFNLLSTSNIVKQAVIIFTVALQFVPET